MRLRDPPTSTAVLFITFDCVCCVNLSALAGVFRFHCQGASKIITRQRVSLSNFLTSLFFAGFQNCWQTKNNRRRFRGGFWREKKHASGSNENRFLMSFFCSINTPGQSYWRPNVFVPHLIVTCAIYAGIPTNQAIDAHDLTIFMLRLND
jgi:hypothetical protein